MCTLIIFVTSVCISKYNERNDEIKKIRTRQQGTSAIDRRTDNHGLKHTMLAANMGDG